MLGIATPVARQLDWSLKGSVAAADGIAGTSATRNWSRTAATTTSAGSYFDERRLPESALDHWQKAVAAARGFRPTLWVAIRKRGSGRSRADCVQTGKLDEAGRRCSSALVTETRGGQRSPTATAMCTKSSPKSRVAQGDEIAAERQNLGRQGSTRCSRTTPLPDMEASHGSPSQASRGAGLADRATPQ